MAIIVILIIIIIIIFIITIRMRDQLHPMTNTLHFYNTPKVDEDSLVEIFTSRKTPTPRCEHYIY